MNITQDLVSTTDLVGPDRARHMRETMNFERQRNISQINVDRLAHEMEAQRFVPGTQVYICVLPDGSMAVVNGNHTLEAIDQCKAPQLLCLTYKQVASVDEAGAIYAVFDMHKRRTSHDSLKAVDKLDYVKNAPKVLSALTVIRSNFAQFGGYTEQPRPELIEGLDEYQEAAELHAAAMAGAEAPIKKLFLRASVMAVALETLRWQPSAASEFWLKAAQNDGLTIGMPERALLRWLQNVQLTAGEAARKEHAKAAACAWNASWRGESPEFVKPGAMYSFHLLGTPWDKGLKVDPQNTGPRRGAAAMIELLKRPEGATVEQIAEATGWRRHTVRGRISEARKKTPINLYAVGGSKVYRLANSAGL